jgi:murein DD-endopeptidase MepM/ murein hydrolase activator NlpD
MMGTGQRLGIFLLALALILSLGGCGPTPTPLPLPTLMGLSPAPEQTSLPPTATASPLPQPTATSTLMPSPTPLCPATDACLFSAFVFERPILPPDNTKVARTYRYGSTQGGDREPHHGVEFVNRPGVPVLAAADGVVVFAGTDDTGLYHPIPNIYGNLVIIEHDNLPVYGKLFSMYAHLSKIDVSVNQKVTTGEQIGEVGMTGMAIGNHLHFEIRQDFKNWLSTLNPELWLIPRPDDDGTLRGGIAIRVVDASGAFVPAAINVQAYEDPAGTPVYTYIVETYDPETLNLHSYWQENAAISDLPPGRYRVSVVKGTLYEHWIDVKSEKITVVTFVVK